ncbi:GntR family transcriptional regulator [Acidimangrovimonas sediminis]|uniref:GntR family transcriptional regulator n=1 Tax=Acidimangrovimonas sediminis TaxID=2056283 RepID=UPI001304E07E|nr:GntR family transcriptional regulator [Acidimangrovimonas sediminis]
MSRAPQHLDGRTNAVTEGPDWPVGAEAAGAQGARAQGAGAQGAGAPETATLVEILRDRIVREVFVSGQRLREREIAEEFAVSRAQVREAFSVLTERRLLDRKANVGVTVARLGPEEIAQLYELRGAVEGLAARLAAERAPEGAWDDLLHSFGAPADEMIAAADLEGYGKIVDEAQQRLVRYAANAVLNETMGVLADRSAVLARRSILLPGRTDVGLKMHRELLAALIARDGEAAERIKRANLADACERLVRFAHYLR